MPFPFTSQAATKRRPAVIISSRADNTARADVVVMAITSQRRPVPGLAEVWVSQWQAAGLLKPSAIKPRLRYARASPHPSPTRHSRSRRPSGAQKGYCRDASIGRGARHAIPELPAPHSRNQVRCELLPWSCHYVRNAYTFKLLYLAIEHRRSGLCVDVPTRRCNRATHARR